MMRTSYHNHTTWSDGEDTLEAMIEAAKKAGLEELGVSDHYVQAPGNPSFDWALSPDTLDDYIAHVEETIAATNGITVRLGLEVDYFPKTIEQIKERLARYSFDFLITSVHFIDDFALDLKPQSWEAISQESRDEKWRSYWQRLLSAVESRCFDIIGHFDLPKKYGFFPSIDLTKEALAALDAMEAADMVIEINASGWDKPVQEAYPSFFYLKEARRRGIPLVINTDSHKAEDVARNFDRARRMALQAGYTELVRFEQRNRSFYAL
jgi:histidinol-phosphatase (PHP family)